MAVHGTLAKAGKVRK